MTSSANPLKGTVAKMDIATLIGILVGLICIGYGLLSGGSPQAFLDIPSVFIVIGGGAASAFISYRVGEVAKIIQVVAKAFTSKDDVQFAIIETLVNLSKTARRNGLLAIENDIEKIEDEYLKSALRQVVDGEEPDSIRESMLIELESLKARHTKGQSFFKTLGSMFPAWGMIGTLIGLINLLRSLDDPSKIGPAMAVALITTFYGSILANFICLPLVNKLALKSKEEVQLKDMMIEGVLSLQAGVNSRTLEKRLTGFLSPEQRITYQKRAPQQ
jgi:chemotaxis protein MotA